MFDRGSWMLDKNIQEVVVVWAPGFYLQLKGTKKAAQKWIALIAKKIGKKGWETNPGSFLTSMKLLNW